MAASDQQLLQMHKQCLDTIRSAVRGLGADALSAREPNTGASVASEVVHLCRSVEALIQHTGFEPRLNVPADDGASAETLLAALDRAQVRFEELMAENPGHADLRARLCRLSLHALSHQTRVVHLRLVRQPDWKVPGRGEEGSWGRAVEFVGDLILGQ